MGAFVMSINGEGCLFSFFLLSGFKIQNQLEKENTRSSAPAMDKLATGSQVRMSSNFRASLRPDRQQSYELLVSKLQGAYVLGSSFETLVVPVTALLRQANQLHATIHHTHLL